MLFLAANDNIASAEYIANPSGQQIVKSVNNIGATLEANEDVEHQQEKRCNVKHIKEDSLSNAEA